ncbi:MAG: inorganic phosphate transporter [Chloroflexi bacterium]|nr:inorganic phosphate transporter [Chloroflexota bacterium]
MFIAFANGQNDVSKGIATLVGSGVTGYRRAILWGSVWTGLGGLAGAILGTAMISTFGRGLLSPDVAPTYAAALATILGAASWVTIATRSSLPVSTTHAIVGSLTGVAVLAYGVGGVHWETVAHKLVLPLIAGPFLALAATAAILTGWRPGSRGVRDCACIVSPTLVPITAMSSGGVVRIAITGPQVVVATSAECARERPAAVRVTLDHLHWLTSGATSFARGLNDAPKIVALVIAGSLLSGGAIATSWWFAVVTLAMVTGSLFGGLRVTRVLAEKVTPMDHREGFSANLVTATLVGLAAYKGLPLSTTHVSTGAILGAGVTRKAAIDWKTVRHLLLAWIVTVPAAAVLGMIAYVAVRWIG